jgi:secreted Zn-dependent insulinase-like peptidase
MISFSLTDLGAIQWQKVIEITFMYLNQLKKDDPKKYIFTESKKMTDISFQL